MNFGNSILSKFISSSIIGVDEMTVEGDTMAMSYSCHVGSKDHSIRNASDLSKVANHNLRKFQRENKDIEIVRGSADMFGDVQRAYDELFGEAVAEYNAKQKRKDRKIDDYFYHVSDSSKSHLATELIIQVGDKDFWKTIDKDSWRLVQPLYEKQLIALNALLPDFKICNAVIHYDESSPHMQIVGVPIAEYSKGLRVRSAKSEVFTQDTLRDEIQTQLRAVAEEDMQRIFFQSFEEKKEGHKYLDVLEYKVQQEQSKLDAINQEMVIVQQQLLDQQEQLRITDVKLAEKEEEVRNRDVMIQKQHEQMLVNADTIRDMKEYRETAKGCFDQLDELRHLVLGQYSNNWWPFRNRKAERNLLSAIEKARDYVLVATAALAAFEYRANIPDEERVSERINEGLKQSVDLLISNASERAKNRPERTKTKDEWER